MFFNKSDKEEDKILKYLKILPSLVVPIEVIFKDFDDEIDNKAKRVKFKMAFVELLAVSIGLKSDAIKFLTED